MGLLTFGNRRRARVVCNGAQSGPRSGNFQLVRFSVARTAAWSPVMGLRVRGGAQSGPVKRSCQRMGLWLARTATWLLVEAHRTCRKVKPCCLGACAITLAAPVALKRAGEQDVIAHEFLYERI